MKLPDLDSENEPKFDVGDHVWVIWGKSPQKANVLSISFELLREGDPSRFKYFALTGYQLSVYDSNHPGLMRASQHFPPYQVFATRAEVEELVQWHPISGISWQEWYKVLGDYDSDDIDGSFEASEAYHCRVSSNISSLLSKCRQEGGLMERDLRFLKEMLSVSDYFKSSKAPNISKILAQLEGLVKE